MTNGELRLPSAIIFDNLGWEEDSFLLSRIRFKPTYNYPTC